MGDAPSLEDPAETAIDDDLMASAASGTFIPSL
jgi:hypothetical protein